MLTGTPGHLKSFDYIGLHRYSLTKAGHYRRKTVRLKADTTDTTVRLKADTTDVKRDPCSGSVRL